MPSTFRCTDYRRAEGPYDAGGVVADSEVMVKQPPPGQLFGSLVSAFGCPETAFGSSNLTPGESGVALLRRAS